MAEREHVYLLGKDGDPEPLVETPYKSEAALQELIADHPEVLAGEQMTPDVPRRWLLIRREMGIADSAESGDRWAVDHLLLDQDARPTLVEVKRSENSEIRRRIVGQMLDYAAHATRYWIVSDIRKRFETDAGSEDAARDQLAQRLGVGSEPDEDTAAYEAFWERVDTNLRADNVRLLFVADRIPDELAHVVEFLNCHMPHIEVLAGAEAVPGQGRPRARPARDWAHGQAAARSWGRDADTGRDPRAVSGGRCPRSRTATHRSLTCGRRDVRAGIEGHKHPGALSAVGSAHHGGLAIPLRDRLDAHQALLLRMRRPLWNSPVGACRGDAALRRRLP